MRIALLGLAGLLAVPAAAQQVPEVRLSRADARFPHEFSSLTGLRELADGRVLVTDGIDGTFLRLDFSTGRADTVGRSGQGPGEYKTPDALFPMPDGATLLVDLGNGRLSVFDATGAYRESIPIARGEPGRGMTMVFPRGTDAQGRLYYQTTISGPGQPRDSAAVLRYDRARDATDTVTTVKRPDVRESSSGGPSNRNVTVRPVPLSPEDAWNVAPDGRIAVARVGDYRMEWIRPGATPVRGPANSYRPVPVREADKREWMESLANGLAVRVENRDGQTNVSFSRGGMRQGGTPRSGDFQWPAHKPPFASSGVFISAEGDAWVQRHVPAGEPRLFDVFGPDGALQQRVILPADRTLVGFGRGVVYLRETTEDGLMYLERYRL
jgi:hypothetical protein